MSNNQTIEQLFNKLDKDIKKVVPRIIAETATEYYKERFKTKEWNGKPWVVTKQTVKRGSLLRRSSKLMNSIKPSSVTASMVVISAGSSKVPYARIHNEGGVSKPKVTPRMRKWAWANYYKEAGKGTTKRKSGQAYTSWSSAKSRKVNFYKGLALTKKSRLSIKIPQRQFMGINRELSGKIRSRITEYLNSN